jgi:hypothetical protein
MLVLTMAAGENSDDHAHLSPRELARLRARDRKRTTRMVVDNAGVKRILLARRERAAAGAAPRPAPGRPEGQSSR